MHTLAPREVLNYTWDDPDGKKKLRWNFPSAIKIHNCKPIEVIKVGFVCFHTYVYLINRCRIGYGACFMLCRTHKLLSL